MDPEGGFIRGVRIKLSLSPSLALALALALALFSDNKEQNTPAYSSEAVNSWISSIELLQLIYGSEDSLQQIQVVPEVKAIHWALINIRYPLIC